jgi:hypothetical protein
MKLNHFNINTVKIKLSAATFIVASIITVGCGKQDRPQNQTGITSPNQSATKEAPVGTQLASGPAVVHGTESSAGGGNAVVCFDDRGIPAQVIAEESIISDRFIRHITSVEILDLFHAREARDFDTRETSGIVTVRPGETPSQYAKRIVKRTNSYIPVLEKMIDFSKTQFLTRRSISGLKRIDDADEDEAMPENCVLSTMAAQTGRTDAKYISGVFLDGTRGTEGLKEAEKTLDSPTLVIDERLYNHPKHSIQSRGALILHEYLYLLIRQYGNQRDSRIVREIVSYLVSKNSNQDIRKLSNLLTKAFSPNYQQGKYSIKFPTMLEFWIGSLGMSIQDNLSEYRRKYRSIHPELEKALDETNKMLEMTGVLHDFQLLGSAKYALEHLNPEQRLKLDQKSYSELISKLYEIGDNQRDFYLGLMNIRWDRENIKKDILHAYWIEPAVASLLYKDVRESLFPLIAGMEGNDYLSGDGELDTYFRNDPTQLAPVLAKWLLEHPVSRLLSPTSDNPIPLETYPQRYFH